MKYFKAFLAGFFATLIFHQGMLLLLNKLGLVLVTPYNFKPTIPFGVPSVLSLSFFGGIWGILLFALIQKDRGIKLWLKSLVFGALAPTIVAMFIVLPLKGITVSLPMIPIGLILNGFWGVGSCWIIQKMK